MQTAAQRLKTPVKLSKSNRADASYTQHRQPEMFPDFCFAIVSIAFLCGAFLWKPKALMIGVVAVIVIAPSYQIFNSRPADTSSAALIGQQIESGDPVRRVAVVLLFLIGLVLLWNGYRQLRGVSVVGCMLLYLMLACLSICWTDDIDLTLRRLLVAMALTVFSIAVGCVYYGREPDGHIQILRIICWTSAATSLLVMVVALCRSEFDPANPAWRLGSLGHENQIAEVAAVGSLVAFASRRRRDLWPNRAVFYVAFGIPVIVVLLTKSRTTWLGLALALIVVGVSMKGSVLKKARTLALFCLAAGVLVSTPFFQEVWRRGSSDEDMGTGSGRTVLWEKLSHEVGEDLWLGHGYGAFWSPRNVNAAAGDWVATSAHNGYIDIAADLGLAGLALMILLIGASSSCAWRLMKDPQYYELCVVLLALNAMAVGVNMGSNFLHSIESYPMVVLLSLSTFVSHRLCLVRLPGSLCSSRVTP